MTVVNFCLLETVVAFVSQRCPKDPEVRLGGKKVHFDIFLDVHGVSVNIEPEKHVILN